jgi:SWI/SNF-related matrix-associated actin-dependent regulator of chromatin subfamily B member 1
LKSKYPSDSFEAKMQLYAVDPDSGNIIIKSDGKPIPENAKYQFVPRIKCHDCPGKVYNPGQGQNTDGFEIHLKTNFHKQRVEQRKKSDR